MIRFLLMIAAAAVLAGCAAGQAAKQELAANPAGTMVVVATLATNACEAAAAPFVTALGVRRIAAARALRLGQIPVATAERVQAVADDARARLIAACPRGVTNAGAADPAITYARTRIAEIETMLGAQR